MCGICGIVGYKEFDGGEGIVKKMVTKLRHRGPDFEDVWTSPDKRVVLGHTRLSIIDVDQRSLHRLELRVPYSTDQVWKWQHSSLY